MSAEQVCSKLQGRFSDMELFAMFQVDVAPHIEWDKASRRSDDGGFNDVKVPLWGFRKRALKRGERKTLQEHDHLKEGVSTRPPGSSRVEDLAAFYAANGGNEESPFNQWGG